MFTIKYINVAKGRVANKYIKDGEHLVDCKPRAENQAGLTTARDYAVVSLASKK